MRKADEQFELAYRKYYAKVFRYLRHMSFSADEAHDLAQDTFKRFYERIDHYDTPEQAWALLCVIARTVSLNFIRARQAHKRGTESASLDALTELPEISANPFTGEETPTREAALIDEQETRLRDKGLAAAIAALSERQRQCIQLWVQGFSYTDIARVLGLSVDAVRSSLRDAKRSMRERLDGSA